MAVLQGPLAFCSLFWDCLPTTQKKKEQERFEWDILGGINLQQIYTHWEITTYWNREISKIILKEIPGDGFNRLLIMEKGRKLLNYSNSEPIRTWWIIAY